MLQIYLLCFVYIIYITVPFVNWPFQPCVAGRSLYTNKWIIIIINLGPGVPHCPAHISDQTPFMMCCAINTHSQHTMAISFLWWLAHFINFILKLLFKEPPLNICIHHNIQWKLCFYIRAKCYDQNWLPWSILPIFLEKEHIVVFEMNWIYAVVL